LGGTGTISIGFAAHITAAAPGGPRHDRKLTSAERRAQANGIWLCGSHAKLIDSDEKHFSVALLHKWKQQAEEKAFMEVATARHGATFPHVQIDLDEEDRALIRGLGLPSEDDLEGVTKRIRAASQADILAFKSQREWPSHSVNLNLNARDSSGTHAIDISGLAAAIHVAREASLVAAPGTGKTTTLVQTADAILATCPSVAVLVPFAEWSSRSDTILQSLTHRNAFQSFREQHFMLLAVNARLVLLLDGWNELDPESKKRAIHEMSALRRDYPLLAILISTRRQARDVPISGPTIEIEALSDGQQLEIARAFRGDDGEALLDQAWRTPGVRELISIPLYLNALLLSAKGATMPRTKEEVLRIFVDEHEKRSDRAATLEHELLGVHRELLIALAIGATNSANTVIQEGRARAVISEAEAKLVEAGQITERPQPGTVLDVLVNQHILVRSGRDDSVSFQHQQFQEWYASFGVERTMLSASVGDSGAVRKLAIDMLNMPAWEESVLFACERLSRADVTGIKAVANAILKTLSIDPLLAAEMIYRSADDVWASVSSEVVSFGVRWHKPGKVDRALNFMITTGRAEFSPYVWSLVANANDQVHLSALRVARRFRPSVLGEDVARQMAQVPDGIRENVLSEIASRSGFDGIELATRLAKTDPSPTVQCEVIESLLFRRADRFALDILNAAPDTVWTLLAKKGYEDEIDDENVAARLRRERHAHIERETNPLRKLARLLDRPNPDSTTAKQVAELIESEQFPVKESDASWKFKEALERYPNEAGKAMLRRIELGRAIPFRAEEFLKAIPPVDDGAIAAMVLDPKNDNDLAKLAPVLVGEKTVGALLDSLLELNQRIKGIQPLDEPTRSEYWRLHGRIAATRANAFLPALIRRSVTKDPHQIALLADLLARHGSPGEVVPLSGDPAVLASITAIVQNWLEALLTSPDATRHDFSEVVRVIERVPHPTFIDGLRRLLDEDFTRWRRARQQLLERPMPSDIRSDARTSYSTQYQRAFAAIGGDQVAKLMESYLPDLDFGVDAACVMKEIWKKERNIPKEDFFRPSPDYSEVATRRAKNQQQAGNTSAFAKAIFGVVEKFGRPACDEAHQLHALSLAKVALSMPHGNKDLTIQALLRLPLSHAVKHALMTSLVLAGEVINADLVLTGLRGLLDDAKTKSWLLDDNVNRIGERIALLPFSDRPRAIFEALELVDARFREPWKLRGLVSALGKSPDPQSEAILAELATRDPRFYRVHEWVSALLGRPTVTTTRLLLDLISSAALPQGQESYDGWRLSNELAGLIHANPVLRQELLQRYADLKPGKGRSILEQAVVELATPDGLMAMIKVYAAEKRPFDGALSRMLERIALGKQPVSESPDAYELYSVDVSNLRKQLFAMLNGPEANVAEACLTAIDELRDEHGRADSEPRHPDLTTGCPWPQITGS